MLADIFLGLVIAVEAPLCCLLVFLLLVGKFLPKCPKNRHRYYGVPSLVTLNPVDGGEWRLQGE